MVAYEHERTTSIVQRFVLIGNTLRPIVIVVDLILFTALFTLVGSLQSELGCPGDWDPACAASHLTLDATDGVWQGTWTVPAGSYEYKVALNGTWDENYGANAQPGGSLTRSGTVPGIAWSLVPGAPPGRDASSPRV